MIEWNTAIEMGLEDVDYIKLEKMDIEFNSSKSYGIELATDEQNRVQFHATVSVDDESEHSLSIFYEYGIGKVSYPDISDFFNAMKERFPK